MNTPAKVVCNRCTYDLTGHASDGPITCPECGQADAARVETHTPEENNDVLYRVAFAIIAAVLSFLVLARTAGTRRDEEKLWGAVTCVLVGFAVAGAISARRHARGSNMILANVIFIFVGVYTVLFFAGAIALRVR